MGYASNLATQDRKRMIGIPINENCNLHDKDYLGKRYTQNGFIM